MGEAQGRGAGGATAGERRTGRRQGLRAPLTRIGAGDNLADAGLVEALEAVVAFEDFHVRAEGAVAAELARLFARDEAAGQRRVDALRRHGPDLALGEG